MKTMTCQQLGGACDEKFTAETFDEISAMSKQHGVEMMEKRDAAHLAAMRKMSEMMQNPQAMEDWFEGKRQEFEALPED